MSLTSSQEAKPLSPTEGDLTITNKNYIVVPKSKYKNLARLKLYQFDSRYVCDTDGNVYLIKAHLPSKYVLKKMNPFTTRDGYIEYVLTTKNGTKKHIQAQRIVAGLYLSPVRDKPYINHKDLDRTNNSLKNLEYMSHAENIQHSYDTNKDRRTGNQYTVRR